MKRAEEQEYVNLDLSRIHVSWNKFFYSQIDKLRIIDNLIQGDVTPKREDIFKIFSMPISQIRFVIVGQDPYPQKGHATGRSFERDLENWESTNASLKAILASIYYHQKEHFLPIDSVLQELDATNWKVSPPSELFKKWEQEKGVFFLNKSLTTKLYVRNGHSDIWRSFVSELITFMSNTLDVIWLLWGNEAHKLSSLIKSEHSIVKAIHPAAYSYSGGNEAEQRLKKFIASSGLDLICN